MEGKREWKGGDGKRGEKVHKDIVTSPPNSLSASELYLN